jgi:proteasome lid subunit RPN8/RPN11
MLHLDEKLAAAIRAHGAQAYPHECCGALLGREGAHNREVLELLPLPNRRQDSAHNRFALAPQDVLRAEKTARARGLEVLGWYHSHPDHPALPSAYDRAHAWPWYSYVIVSVERGAGRMISSWRLADDRARFALEPVVVRALSAPATM